MLAGCSDKGRLFWRQDVVSVSVASAKVESGDWTQAVRGSQRDESESNGLTLDWHAETWKSCSPSVERASVGQEVVCEKWTILSLPHPPSHTARQKQPQHHSSLSPTQVSGHQ